MNPADRLRRAVSALERRALDGSDHLALRQGIAAAVGSAVGYEVACVATVDPVAAMWTHCAVEGMERDHTFEALLFDAEYRHEDIAPMAEIARWKRPVAVLSRETGGDLNRAVRYRTAFGPAGLGDEVRLVLADAGVPWGSVQLLRGPGDRFTESEAEALAEASVPLARLLRLSLLRTAASRPGEVEGDPPGVLLLGADDRIEEANQEAEALLGGPLHGTAPAAVHGVAVHARLGRTASMTIPGPAGGWLTFHGARLGARVTILVERARPRQLAEVVVRALGLTARERDVVGEVVRGHPTKEIATRLRISEWTVQDHLKAIFAKTGVSSRQELVAAVFFGHWAPEHQRGSTPSPYGHYLHTE